MAASRNALLRKRYEVGVNQAVFFTFLVIAVMLFWLWDRSPRAGLVTWAAVLAVTAPWPSALRKLDLPFPTWYRLRFACEALLGIAWGLLPLLAMPGDPTDAALMCAALIGVLIASSATSSQFFYLYVAFVAPFGTLSIAGFLRTEPALTMPALFVAVAFVYGVTMMVEHRATHSELVDTLAANDQLVGQLGADRDALTAANVRLDHQARTDALTGLSNRSAMTRDLDELFHETSEHAPLTLAYLDLDGFKEINDSLGHGVGDLVLKAVAERLEAAVGNRGSVYRLGGDEITIATNELAPPELGDRLAAVFDEPFDIDGRPLVISAGVGVASTTERCSVDEFLGFADRALYRHKERRDRSTRFQIFNGDMLVELREQESAACNVAIALDNGGVNAWFQPIVDLETGRFVAAEALARWEHPDGARSAERFVDHLAEQNLLGALADRMVEQSHDLGIRLAAHNIDDFRIAVNLPPVEIAPILSRYDGTPTLQNLMFEVTETSLSADDEQVTETLERARTAGATILLDDVGAGHSSLLSMTTLPIDGLKIDDSFVRDHADPRTRAIIAALVDLGRRLDLVVIAEGVESAAQAAALRELGVTHAQGFFYCGPLQATQLVARVTSASTGRGAT